MGTSAAMRGWGEAGSRPTATPCGCAKPALETGNLLTEPIGFLESCFLTKNGTPRQPSICSHSRACLRIRKSIFNNPEHSLVGLEQFSHIWVLFVFHKNGHLSCKAKVQPPRLNGAKVGVFSTRSPHRPNAIGLTLARLEKVEGGALYLSGIDMIHGTPVLDVKPYIADYDAPQSFTEPLADCSSRSDRRQPKATAPSGAETQSCDQRQLPECSEPQLPGSPKEKLKCLEDGSSGEEDKTNDRAADARRNPTGRGVVAAERGSDPRAGQRAGAAEEATDPDGLDRSVSEGGAERRPRSGAGAAGPQEHRTEMQPQRPRGLPSVAGAAQRCVVPTWVKEAPLVASLQVRFTPHAEKDLVQLSSEGEADARQASFRYFQSAQEARWAIEAVLAADPRSVYRRKLCRDRLYYFSVDRAHVTCWFGDDFAEVLRIKPVPETVRVTDAAPESLVSRGPEELPPHLEAPG